MYLYESSRSLYDYLKIPESQLQEKNFVCGGFSKILAVLLTYPLTTMRTRIQQNQYFNKREKAKYNGVGMLLLTTVKEEGIRGFYKGVGINLMRGIPQRGIYFYCYEIFKDLLGAGNNVHKHIED